MGAKFGTKDHKFGVQFTPGCGTFENYLEFGLMCGASPDGRRNGDPIASDLSSMPMYSYKEPNRARYNIQKRLKGVKDPKLNLITEGAPFDVNILESFPVNDLKDIIKDFV